MSLSSLIVQREVATIRQVEEALARQVLYGGDLVTNLLEVVQLPEEVLVPLLAESLGMHAAPLGELPPPDERARSLVPAELATRRALAPLTVSADRLVLAVAEPLPGDVVEELSFALGMTIEQRVAPMARIRQALSVWYGAPFERRMQRLVDRLSGIDTTQPNSLPPLLRVPPSVAEPPRPDSRPTHVGSIDPEIIEPITAVDLGTIQPTPVIALAPATDPMPTALDIQEHPGDSIRTRPTPAWGASVHATASGFPAPAADPPHTTASGFPPPRFEPPPPPAEPARRTAPPPSAGLAPRAPDAPEPVASLIHESRSSAPPRLGRRRRGPLTLENAKAELDAAEERDALLDLLFDFARQFFDYTAMFIVHGDIAEGREAFGQGASRERVAAIGVPLDLPSVLATAREQRAPVVARAAPDGLDAVLMADLERKTRTPILVVPVIVRQRAVALVLGDGGDMGIDGRTQGEVASFAVLVGQAFERIIVKRKLSGFHPGTEGGTARVDPTRVKGKQVRSVRPKVDRSVAADVLERALLVQKRATDKPPPLVPGEMRAVSDHPPDTALPSTVPDRADRIAAQRSRLAESSPPPIHTERELKSPFPRPAPEPHDQPTEADIFGAIAEQPPPPQVAAVRRPSGPPIPREEPVDSALLPALVFEPTPSVTAASSAAQEQVADGEARALLDDIENTSPSEEVTIDGEVDRAPPSQSVVVPPHRPPPPVRASPQPLPSVIVDVEREFGALVDRLIADARDEHAEAELLRQGQYAMPAIMARFPGPIVIARERLDDMPAPRVIECGPILRLVAGQRRVALPFVLQVVASQDPERRFWGVYLLTELVYPEAVPAVVASLFDEKERTRNVARIAAKALAEVAPEQLVEALDAIVTDPAASSQKRVATVDTLGEMRDAIVVPVLIGALADDREEVALAARRSLMIVTRQDFGRDARRWLAWWSSNSSRHRVEWLIDALTHEVPAMRRVAGQELKALTKEYFGYYDDLPKKERERAQQRYREWWKTEGRARFRRL